MSDQPPAVVSVDIDSFSHDGLVGLPAIAAYVEQVVAADAPAGNG
jgi:hypothetical protein